MTKKSSHHSLTLNEEMNRDSEIVLSGTSEGHWQFLALRTLAMMNPPSSLLETSFKSGKLSGRTQVSFLSLISDLHSGILSSCRWTRGGGDRDRLEAEET